MNPVRGGRRKTPAQIESQFSRLYMQNYRNGDDFGRGSRIVQAAKNVRRANGYESTGKSTRYSDTIFRRDNGSLFTVQNGREVAYRGKRAGAQSSRNSAMALSVG